MGRKRFDKKNATTFSVVHRSHEDSLYYDNDASKHVLVPAPQKQVRSQAPTLVTLSQQPEQRSHKSISTKDLESKLGNEIVGKMRANEGLAAQYGIFFDDSKYDYMQHLKPIGQSGDAVFVEAKQERRKPKTKIEDLIKDALPSEQTRRVGIDDTENIPSELQGFNPEMDARLREVLGALEDEAYIAEDYASGEDEDFVALLKSGEVDDDEFYYGSGQEDDYDEWDLDNYEDEYNEEYDSDKLEQLENPYNEGEMPEDIDLAQDGNVVSNAWMKDFMKFKKETKNKQNEWDSDDEFEEEDGQQLQSEAAGEDEDTVGDLPEIKKKGKSKNKMRKKMGTMSDTSSFSMSSSALFRNDGLTLLDDRFEQMNKKYDEPEDLEEPEEFDMSKERPDFENMLDEFLDNYELEKGGRRLVKKDEENARIREAADKASKSKLAAKRKKQMDRLGLSFGGLLL